MLLGLVLLTGSAIGYFYYQHEWKYSVNDKKYPHQIGYLYPDNKDFSENFERCSEKKPIGFFDSATRYGVYKGGKRTFQKFILNNFKNEDYSDTGFLNLRFIINCKGEIGDMEINELDTNLERATLDKNLVDHIIDISVQKKHWHIMDLDEPRDTYMYLIYKIENGAITEILP